MLKLTSEQDLAQLLDQMDTFLFDCDGVLWRGECVIPGVPEALSYLRSLGKQILFVTNNSTQSRRNYVEKMKKFGITANESDIFGSAHVAAYYMKNIVKFPLDKKVYVIGQGGIQQELIREGFRLCESKPWEEEPIHQGKFPNIERDCDVGAVVVGFDLDLSYYKLARAFRYLHDDPKCLFIATNDDATFPAADTIYPGTGSIVAALSNAIGKKPVVLGKPNPTMLDCILDETQFNPQRTCMVGDRLNTDIFFGHHGGLKTLLVLTGVSQEADAQQLDATERPDFIMNSFGEVATLKK